MNLKESFRYQTFLDNMMTYAQNSLSDVSHVFKQTKTHLMSKANANAEDIVEEVQVEDFFQNGDVISFAEFLIGEKRELGEAISKAKAEIDIDLDAYISANKYRRNLVDTLRYMINARKRKPYIEKGTGYVFNNDGNQSPYYYDISVSTDDNFDREDIRKRLNRLAELADYISNQIEMALVNTEVSFEPSLNVNGTFADNMELFINTLK